VVENGLYFPVRKWHPFDVTSGNSTPTRTKGRKLLWGIGVVVMAVWAIPVLQRSAYERRESALRQMPTGATKEQVVALFGEPSYLGAGGGWYYSATLLGGLSIWKSDDMLITFEEGKVDYYCLTPE
jgi:hypothetical protein